MKILLVLVNYYPYVGGSELLFQKLAEGLVKRGHEVLVLTSKMEGLKKHEKVNGVVIERINLPNYENPFLFTLASIPRVAKLAREFDIIQTSSNYSALSAFIGSFFRKGKLVLTSHEVVGNRWNIVFSSKLRAFIYRLIEKTVVRLPYDHHICISNSTKRGLIASGVKAEKIEVFYPGVEMGGQEENSLKRGEESEFSELFSQDHFTYLYYGRPGVTKGINYLIDAVPEISQKIPNSKLLMVLSSNPETELRKIRTSIKEKGLEEKIILIPSFTKRSDLFNFIRQSDCIVIPSLNEGFSFTTVEASNLEVPVVASAVASIPEVIFGKHVLVESANSSAIAEGVLRIFNQDVDYLDKKVFSWETMLNQYEACYLALLEDNGNFKPDI